MRIYRYERFDRPQSVLDEDRKLASGISSEFLLLQRHIRQAIHSAEEPNFERSLRELDHALDNFVADEVDSIMTLLEWAQEDIDKESVG